MACIGIKIAISTPVCAKRDMNIQAAEHNIMSISLSFMLYSPTIIMARYIRWFKKAGIMRQVLAKNQAS
jgi:hypothetical protein